MKNFHHAIHARQRPSLDWFLCSPSRGQGDLFKQFLILRSDCHFCPSSPCFVQDRCEVLTTEGGQSKFSDIQKGMAEGGGAEKVTTICDMSRQFLTILRQTIQGPLNGGVSNGGASQSGIVLPFLSFFVLFCPFWDFPDFSGIFPIWSGMVRGFSRFVLFSFFGLLRAPTRNSPERVCDTIWTLPEKSGKPPGLETPGLASLKL